MPNLTPEAQLREALSFLGHNAREGHSSTLALLELQRIKPDPMGLADLVDRVERNARKSLAAIDDFMDMAGARAQPLRSDEIDLADLLIELVADAWSLASRHGVRVQIASSLETAPLVADRELLASALAKLLRDAAARTPRGVDLQCALAEAPGEWLIDIGDPGAPVAEPAEAIGASPPVWRWPSSSRSAMAGASRSNRSRPAAAPCACTCRARERPSGPINRQPKGAIPVDHI